MFEKGKLSFWDIGTYLTVGCFASFSAAFYLFYGLSIPFPSWAKNLKDFSGSLVIIVPIVFLLVGMFIEPIANWLVKHIEKLTWFKPRKIRNKESLVNTVKSHLPDDEIDSVNLYRYCKAVVELKFQNSNHDIFLARFGFYRSMSVLLALIFIINCILFKFDCINISINALLAFCAYQFLKRSQVFKNHMEEAVYYNYLALVVSKDEQQQ
ncbi:hypothetical protein [Shewanella marisflavi]|uniref:Uncharacterized protein n=1 Tax=Shewanella marisflavi TaxID=260364 RepID=A0AAC9TXN1_9GAMM|nr:hypothetical protein [Shewanella marisflavi]ASJ95507.1 hypothetical protein CFF01_02290 [Shewanella marisflavi]